MKTLSTAASVTLSFYYAYVEHFRALLNDEMPKGLGFAHFFAISCNYGYRPKAYNKLHEIARRHFPKAFIVTGWKALVVEILLSGDPNNYPPSLGSLAKFVKNEPTEKRDLFLRDLYAAV